MLRVDSQEERAYYIARKNIEKAFDAILVAIGIVAVLIVNVTFVGKPRAVKDTGG